MNLLTLLKDGFESSRDGRRVLTQVLRCDHTQVQGLLTPKGLTEVMQRFAVGGPLSRDDDGARRVCRQAALCCKHGQHPRVVHTRHVAGGCQDHIRVIVHKLHDTDVGLVDKLILRNAEPVRGLIGGQCLPLCLLSRPARLALHLSLR